MSNHTQIQETPVGDGRSSGSSLPSYLDQTLWHALTSSAGIDEFSEHWLAMQCAMISGVSRAVVIVGSGQDFRPAAQWPPSSALPKALAGTSETALQERQGVVRKYSSEDEVFYHIAMPLLWNEAVHGVVTIEIPDAPREYLTAVMRQLQWGCVWFENFERRENPKAQSAQAQQLVIIGNLIASCLEHGEFQSAASAVVTGLADALDCERVSVGFRSHAEAFVGVAALSHSANFDKKTNLVKSMAEAMQECIDQNHTVVIPAADELLITRAHDVLVATGGVSSVCSVPLYSDEKLVGALLFERSGGTAFNPEQRELCEQAAMFLGPLLDLKRKEDRWIGAKVREALTGSARKVFGPGHFRLKATLTVTLTLLALLLLIKGDYRVRADAVLEGWVQRSITAPFDGYVMESVARAGDTVLQGDVLFRLDDSDLQLELLKWKSQLNQVEKEYLNALVSHKKAEVSILKARREQAEANLALIESQLQRTVATAPLDGIVVSGDLSQDLGKPVLKGEVLMEVAPLAGYRVILEVGEGDVTDITVGQSGMLSLSSMPGEIIPFEVERVTSIATIDQGLNVFRVEARLEKAPATLRPGMQGTGKIMVDRRSLASIWTSGFFDWLRVWSWAWWP